MNRGVLSDKARLLYVSLVRRYRERGYLYSGCVTGGVNKDAIEELERKGLVQRRRSLSSAWELPRAQRYRLIKAYHLENAWLTRGGKVYDPTGRDGEITKVVGVLEFVEKNRGRCDRRMQAAG